MSSDPHKPAILLTQSKIALVLSIVTLLMLGFQGSRYLLDQNYRIATLEEKWSNGDNTQREFANELRNLQRDVASELRTLNSSLNELNLVLREVQVRQERGDTR